MSMWQGINLPILYHPMDSSSHGGLRAVVLAMANSPQSSLDTFGDSNSSSSGHQSGLFLSTQNFLFPE